MAHQQMDFHLVNRLKHCSGEYLPPVFTGMFYFASTDCFRDVFQETSLLPFLKNDSLDEPQMFYKIATNA